MLSIYNTLPALDLDSADKPDTAAAAAAAVPLPSMADMSDTYSVADSDARLRPVVQVAHTPAVAAGDNLAAVAMPVTVAKDS